MIEELKEGHVESPAETDLRVKVNELVRVVNCLCRALTYEPALRTDYVQLLEPAADRGREP